MHSFIHAFIHSFIHAFIHSFMHAFIRSFIHSFIHSFMLRGEPVRNTRYVHTCGVQTMFFWAQKRAPGGAFTHVPVTYSGNVFLEFSSPGTIQKKKEKRRVSILLPNLFAGLCSSEMEKKRQRAFQYQDAPPPSPSQPPPPPPPPPLQTWTYE